jgi:hypothetical protein
MAEKFQIKEQAAAPTAEKKGNPLSAAFKALSKREQIMIYLVVIVGVIAAFVFFVAIPAMDNLTTLQTEADELQAQEMEYRQVISQTATYNQMYDEALAAYNKAKKKYFKPMKPETLDEKVTGYLVDAGFDPQTLSMSTLNVEGVPSYLPTVLRPTAVPEVSDPDTTSEGAVDGDGLTPKEETEAAAAAADSGYAEQEAATGGAPAFVYTVNVSVEGEWSNLYKLLDKVRKKSGIEIISYQYNESAAPVDISNPSASVASKDSVNMVLKLYVYVKGVPASTGNGDAAVQ